MTTQEDIKKDIKVLLDKLKKVEIKEVLFDGWEGFYEGTPCFGLCSLMNLDKHSFNTTPRILEKYLRMKFNEFYDEYPNLYWFPPMFGETKKKATKNKNERIKFLKKVLEQ